MKTKSAFHVPLITTALFVLVVCSSAGAAELSATDWSDVRAAYESGRHKITAVEGGHVARNPGQHWRTRFDRRGFFTEPESGGWQ